MDGRHEGPPVVVGVDGSGSSRTALRRVLGPVSRHVGLPAPCPVTTVRPDVSAA